MVELVDARDSKSLECIIHAGSIPATGTILKNKPDRHNAVWLLLFYYPKARLICSKYQTFVAPNKNYKEQDHFLNPKLNKNGNVLETHFSPKIICRKREEP